MAQSTNTRPQAHSSAEAMEPHAEASPPSPGAVEIPIPVIGVRRVHVSAPSMPKNVDLSASLGQLPQTVKEKLPDRNQLIYYGGLGALAAVGIVSWPVAAAIGAGVWVAGRARAASAKAGA